jgi:hypothetical protein
VAQPIEPVTPAYFYTGHSLGWPGTIVVIAALVLRLGWMFWRRRRRG